MLYNLSFYMGCELNTLRHPAIIQTAIKLADKYSLFLLCLHLLMTYLNALGKFVMITLHAS